jgi:hypothetical protein
MQRRPGLLLSDLGFCPAMILSSPRKSARAANISRHSTADYTDSLYPSNPSTLRSVVTEDGSNPWSISVASCPLCALALTAFLSIRSVDILGAPAQASGPSAGWIWGANEPFYGTMAGPWWYHTGTSVPRVRNLPFSALRMLMLRGRLAWPGGPVRALWWQPGARQ